MKKKSCILNNSNLFLVGIEKIERLLYFLKKIFYTYMTFTNYKSGKGETQFAFYFNFVGLISTLLNIFGLIFFFSCRTYTVPTQPSPEGPHP